jgi:glycosyltransferase involved in cell wall biosynthesis
MGSSPLVSVALCTYNGEKYLAEQIESIINQTYTNLDIVIVDDRSTDSTFNIAKQYAEKDARVRCISNSENLGFNKNFEKALSLTRGDFIAISDQDDIWEPKKIQVLVNSIKDNWLVFSNSIYITGDGIPTGNSLLQGFKFGNWDFRSTLILNYITGHTCVIARQFLEYILPFPITGYYDWWMGFIALYHNKITYVDSALTRYRVHESSVIQNVLKNDKLAFEILDFKTSLTMLANFATYKNLRDPDRKLITALRDACEQKLKKSYHLPLILLINKHYHAIFPNNKKRKRLSKFGFAIKYSRKLG